MFYNLELLCRGGRFFSVWSAATRGIKALSNKDIAETNIEETCVQILQMVMTESRKRRFRLSLALAAKLLHGCVRIYARHVQIVFKDVNVLIVSIHESLIVKQHRTLHPIGTSEEDTPKVVPKRKKPAKKPVDSDEITFEQLMGFPELADNRVLDSLQEEASRRPPVNITLTEVAGPSQSLAPLDRYDFGFEGDVDFIASIMGPDRTVEQQVDIMQAPQVAPHIITVAADVHAEKTPSPQPTPALQPELSQIEQPTVDQPSVVQAAEPPPIAEAVEQPVAEETPVQPTVPVPTARAPSRKRKTPEVTIRPQAAPQNMLIIVTKGRRLKVKEYADKSDLVKDLPDVNEDLLNDLRTNDDGLAFVGIDEMFDRLILHEVDVVGVGVSTEISENIAFTKDKQTVSGLPSISEIPETFRPMPTQSTPMIPSLGQAPIMPEIEATPIRPFPMISELEAISVVPEVEPAQILQQIPEYEMPEITPRMPEATPQLPEVTSRGRTQREKTIHSIDEARLQRTLNCVKESYEMNRLPVTLEDVACKPLTKKTVNFSFNDLLELSKMRLLTLHSEKDSIMLSHIELDSRFL